MKRLLLAVLLALTGWTGAFAAARTASVGGLWNATATWGGAAVPGLADSCTITAAIPVVCDTDPCQCGDLTINGSLVMKDGARTLKLGNATNVAGDGNLTIATTGTLIGGAGQDIEFNVDRTSSVACGVVTNNGSMVWSGNRLFTDGKVDTIGALTDGGSTRYTLLTDNGLQQPVADYFSGKYLVPTSGYFRNHFFAIVGSCTGAATNTVCVDMDTRGALDTRNTVNNVTPQAWTPGDWGEVVYRADGSADDVVLESAATTVVFDAGIFASTGAATNALLGSRIICAADLDTVADADFRRICSVTSATVATLCTAYGTASCTTGGAGFYVLDDNQPPKNVVINEAFQIGDTYEIIDPAITSATNKSNTTTTGQYNMVLNSGSNTRFTDVLIDYCGFDLSGGAQGPSCMEVKTVDNSNDSEQFYITRADLWHPAGEAAIYLRDSSNIAIERVNIHDCAEGQSADGHECHGIFINDDNNVGVSGIVLNNNRITRVNDAGIVQSGDATSGAGCTDCRYTDNVIGFIPANSQGTGSSATGITATDGILHGSVSDSLLINIETSAIKSEPADTTPTSTYDTAWFHNMILNVQNTVAVSFGLVATTFVPDSADKQAFTNNVVIGGMGPLIQRGYLWSNYINVLNVPAANTNSGTNFLQGATGNICLGGPSVVTNASDCYYNEPDTTSEQTLLPSSVVYTDNVAIGHTTQAGSGSHFVFGYLAANALTGTPTFSVNHNSTFAKERYTSANDTVCYRNAPAIGAVNTFTNNVGYDCIQGFREAIAGAGGDSTASYNLCIDCQTHLSNVTDGGNNLTTGTLSFRQMFAGDLSLEEGSTGWTTLGSDGYPRGVRVAGPPNPKSFLRLYPFPLVVDDTGVAPVNLTSSNSHIVQIVNANTIGDVDADADGVWDLHDNCDRNPNPSQLDTDADGAGDACDP